MRQPITDKEGFYIRSQRGHGVPWKTIGLQFGITDRQIQKRFSKWRRTQQANAAAKAPAPPVEDEEPLVIMLRAWPSHWSEMDRRQFCRARARGYGPADVARQLRLEADLVKKAWNLTIEEEGR